ncbi:Fatty acid/phospholipid biosynthesis enzyme [Pseudomonas syringae pv. actinidiae]|uniref:Fatty acid/phospholipid biosynthesis enzyme n=1 Tax=Pseudomonas syringae pv. actinidiae TaxID=103796 RepID=A0AAN4PZV4_PSESF|nr:Fatty acid/phospholipid biosynthesis enzyme [Pseudomonas syringae pv. actinidiae]
MNVYRTVNSEGSSLRSWTPILAVADENCRQVLRMRPCMNTTPSCRCTRDPILTIPAGDHLSFWTALLSMQRITCVLNSAILALRHQLTGLGALHAQNVAWVRQFHILITAKRCHSPRS